MTSRRPPANPLNEPAGVGEPEIDRAKLLAAWISNAETQRAVLRRSSIVGTLAVLATVAQIGVAAVLLRRMDEHSEHARAELAEVRGMIAAALRANATINAADLAEAELAASRMDAVFPPPAEETKPPVAGTVRYDPDAARLAFKSTRLGGASATVAPTPDAGDSLKEQHQEIMETRKAAAAQIQQVLSDLAAKR